MTAPWIAVTTEPLRRLPSTLSQVRPGPTPRPLPAAVLPGLLVAADVIGTLTASLLTRTSWAWFGLFGTVLVGCHVAGRTYRRRVVLSALDDFPRLVLSGLSAIAILVVAMVAVGMDADRRWLLAGILAVGTAAALRFPALAAVRALRRRTGGDRTVVVGACRSARMLADHLLSHPELGLCPVGVVEDAGRAAVQSLPVPLLATDTDDLGGCLERHRIGTILVGLHGLPESAAVDAVIAAHQRGAAILVIPRMSDLHREGPDAELVHGIPLLRLRPHPTSRPSWRAKRAGDVVVAGLGLLLLAPVLGLLAAAVLVDSGRPVLFRQQRVGVGGRPFRLCKLRTLPTVPASESATTWSVVHDPRVRPFGRFLRRTSLDEVPQLWNIVRGDMSLVGPRPERPSFVDRFSGEHERYWARHRVPAGLTGLAQVNGLRGDTSIADRARYDNAYIASWSLWLDVKIVARTAREVVRRTGG